MVFHISRALVCALAVVWSGSALADADPPAPFPVPKTGIAIEVTGPLETVFDWTTDRCDDAQMPDLPVRAFRDADGQINLILSHDSAYAMRGDDFDSLKLDCTPIHKSAYDPDPSQFDDHEWIAAVYTEEGQTVHALLHAEYWGHRYNTGCGSRAYFQCWYNTITAAVSTDAGRSFDHPVDPPGHLVASIPHPYAPDEGIFGAFSPSNIVQHRGYYYALIKRQEYPSGDQHTCLMRTDDLSDPDSWRFWKGSAFDGQFADPYRDTGRTLRAGNCRPISVGEIAQMYEGVVRHEGLDRFILVGTSNDPTRDPEPYGFYYASSGNLITWTRRWPLLEARLPWRATGSQTVYLYPTLIDHDSASRNFETTDGTAHLYFTRLNFGSGNLDRDLVRVPVRIFKQP
ncbi:MAG: hypothetical protein AAF940_03530 [Pseudomonadota bacterium]